MQTDISLECCFLPAIQFSRLVASSEIRLFFHLTPTFYCMRSGSEDLGKTRRRKMLECCQNSALDLLLSRPCNSYVWQPLYTTCNRYDMSLFSSCMRVFFFVRLVSIEAPQRNGNRHRQGICCMYSMQRQVLFTTRCIPAAVPRTLTLL